jgi:hypothetical protein
MEYMKIVDAWTWASDNKLILSGREFKLDGYHHQPGIMQDEHPVQCFKKARQVAGTQSVILVCLHRLIYALYELGVVYLFPTKDTVTDFSTSRFKPLIRENPEAIGQYVTDTDRANLKKINRGHIYFRSRRLAQLIEGETGVKVATSGGLVGIPADAIVFDEWDLMDPGAREIVIGCMADSKIKHEFYLSNPTMPDYGIDKIYQKSDQKVWMIPCDHCSEWTCLEQEWPHCLKPDKNGRIIRACKKCGMEIVPDHPDARWIPMKPDNTEISGRWISHLSAAKVDPKTLYDKWRDPDLDKPNFLRMELGMAYMEAEDRLRQDQLYSCVGPDMIWGSHKGPCAMGIDPGKKIIHVVILDKPTPDQFRLVFCGRFNEWNEVHDTAKYFNIGCCVIDEGYERRNARDFGEQEPYATYLCRYLTGSERFTHWNTDEMLVKVHRTEVCDMTHNLVSTPGKFILPRITPEITQYVFEMTNIAKIRDVDKLTQAIKETYITLDDDHYRHATNYAWLASTQVGISREGSGPKFRTKKRRLGWMAR